MHGNGEMTYYKKVGDVIDKSEESKPAKYIG